MNFEELRKICVKAKKYEKICFILAMPLFIAFVTIMLYLVLGVHMDGIVLTITAIVGFILGSISCVFGLKSDKYKSKAEEYIIDKIAMMVASEIREHFEIEKVDNSCRYEIKFYNPDIKGHYLQPKITNMLNTMNEIADKKISVKFNTN